MMGTQAAVDRRRRSHARARFWAEEGRERQAHVTFLPLRETVVEGNFKKWRRSNEGKWDGSIKASALASRISKF